MRKTDLTSSPAQIPIALYAMDPGAIYHSHRLNNALYSGGDWRRAGHPKIGEGDGKRGGVGKSS